MPLITDLYSGLGGLRISKAFMHVCKRAVAFSSFNSSERPGCAFCLSAINSVKDIASIFYVGPEHRLSKPAIVFPDLKRSDRQE